MSVPSQGDWLAAHVGNSPECWGTTSLTQQVANAGMYDISFIQDVAPPEAPVLAAPARTISFDL